MRLGQNLLQQGAAGQNLEFEYYLGGSADSNGFISGAFSASVNIGPVAPTGFKRVLVIIEGGASGSSNDDISSTSVSVGGEAATLAVEALSNSTSFKQYGAISYVEYPNETDTTATLQITTAASGNRAYGAQILVAHVPETSSPSVYSAAVDLSGTNPFSVSLDLPSGASLSAAVAQMRNGEATPSISFGGTLTIGTVHRADLASDENFYAGSSRKIDQTAESGKTVTFSDPTAADAESVIAGAILVFN